MYCTGLYDRILKYFNSNQFSDLFFNCGTTGFVCDCKIYDPVTNVLMFFSIVCHVNSQMLLFI